MFETPQIRQMNKVKMFRKIPFGPIFLIFPSKVQNLTVFSIIYMIRIRFFKDAGINSAIFSGRAVLAKNERLRF